MKEKRTHLQSENKKDRQDSSPKRKTRDNIDSDDRLESLIAHISFKTTSSLENTIESLAQLLLSQLPTNIESVIVIISDCILNMPEKLTIYSTLIGIMNVHDCHFGTMFLDYYARNLKSLLKKGQYDKALIIVQSICDFVNCNILTENSVLNMFDNFVEVSYDEGIPQSRSDWYCHAVMTALPWAGRIFYEKRNADFIRLLNTIERYINKRGKQHVNFLSVWNPQTHLAQEDLLDVQWFQLQDLYKDHWIENEIPRPYVELESKLSQGSCHILPDVVPPPHKEFNVYPLPSVVFRIFDYNDVPEGLTIPGSHSIERFFIDLSISRLIDSYHGQPKTCAEMLLEFSSPRQVAHNYIISEVLFGKLLSMTSQKLPEIFFGSIWIYLMKINPVEMPQILAQTVSILYKNMGTMNMACINILSRWFSHALSNFHFRWNWDDWRDCLVVNREHPKAKFVAETLRLSMRLSYYEKITSTVPSEMSTLWPHPPECTYPYYDTTDIKCSNTVAASKLVQAIKKKCTVGEMADLLDQLFCDATNVMEIGDSKIEVFFTTLCYLGSNAMSFTFAALTRYSNLLRQMVDGNRQIIVLLNSLKKCWRRNEQMMVILTDKMIRMELIEHVSVINWIFGDDMAKDLTYFYVWEIIHRTIKSVSTKLESLESELEYSKDQYEFNLRKATNSALIGYDEDYGRIDDITPNSLRQLEDKIAKYRDLQCRIFFVIFQRLVKTLSEYITHCNDDKADLENPSFKCLIDRLQQVLFDHKKYTFQYIKDLRSLIFTNEIDDRILDVFYSFCSLKD